VMDANLTFLQQLVAGDGWGEVCVPIIEMFPWTAWLFIAILLSINLGVMNLILTCIVDQAVEFREQDAALQIQTKKDAFQKQSMALIKAFAQIDTDGTGSLSLAELLTGFQTNHEFAQMLFLMGVRMRDLKGLFNIMDHDDSGLVSYKEFVKGLYEMQTSSVQAQLSFVRYQLVESQNDMKRMFSDITDMIAKQCDMQAEGFRSSSLAPTSEIDASATQGIVCRDLPANLGGAASEHDNTDVLKHVAHCIEKHIASIAVDIRQETEKLFQVTTAACSYTSHDIGSIAAGGVSGSSTVARDLAHMDGSCDVLYRWACRLEAHISSFAQHIHRESAKLSEITKTASTEPMVPNTSILINRMHVAIPGPAH